MSLPDENAEILAALEKDGSDLGPARAVDFSHAFPDQISAKAFAAECGKNGFQIEGAETDRNEDPWDVTVSKEIHPSAVNITALEERLDACARSHGGYADGWGFFRA